MTNGSQTMIAFHLHSLDDGYHGGVDHYFETRALAEAQMALMRNIPACSDCGDTPCWMVLRVEIRSETFPVTDHPFPARSEK